MNKSLLSLLKNEIKLNEPNFWEDNWDYRRFGAIKTKSIPHRFKGLIKTIFKFLGISKNSQYQQILAHETELEWIYKSLKDADSKSILVDVLCYRVLGHSKVKLPLNTPEYWDKLSELERIVDASQSLVLANTSRKLSFYDLNQYGYPIKLYASAATIFTQMLLQQYRCANASHVIEVSEGDIVIDAGGCFGDTALYFAHKAGASGKVFSFEFMPDNIKVFKQNLALNPSLASRVEIVPNPLWSSSAERLYVEGAGTGAHITSTPKNSSSLQVDTMSIDNLVKSKGLNQVDFIKMDIEGAELAALKGAIETISTYKPKLAICVYHQLADFWEIAQWIDSLGLDYQFYLRHFTIHSEETVLFAEVF